MDRVDYLGAFRRRWIVVVAAVALGALGGWFTKSITRGSPPPLYEAGTPLLGSTNPEETNLATLSSLTKLGEVPRRVARVLEYEGHPSDLADRISTIPDQGSGILWIIATSREPERAELLANTFATQLVDWFKERRSNASLDEFRRLEKQSALIEREITELEAEILRAPVSQVLLLTAQRDARIRFLGFLEERQLQVTQPVPPAPLLVLEQATADRVATEGEFLGSITPVTRSIAGGALGLLAGLALALLLARFDNRIRTKAAAERSFGLPVLAEIPSLSRRERRTIVEDDGSVSPGVLPFRLLGAVLAQAGPAEESGSGTEVQPAQTILVTSPGTGAGKTRVAGSLAAAYAESGKRVLLLSCDFRRPLIHKLFKMSNETGLSDALTSGNGRPVLEPVAKVTALPNLKVVPSGRATGTPSALLSSEQMGRALDEAREAADVVLLDTPSILDDGDAAYLMDEVDAVLVVARAGRTTMEEAKRTAEILEHLEAPVAGVALNRSAG